MVHNDAQGNVLSSVRYNRKASGEPIKITREDGTYTKLQYDTALRVTNEQFYSTQNALLDERTYVYDKDGKRVATITSASTRTYNYTAGYQLDSITATGINEDYDYDVNGRMDLMQRDGQTLDLDHDVYDRLTAAKNLTSGATTNYVYDSAGRRVKSTSAGNERYFLVAPASGSGLDSTDLMYDQSGNITANYVYAGGYSPFMKLDANGNPIYYLTDGMGSVIGMADRSGQSVAKYSYDSFGNIRSQSGNLTDTTGGDFRFQGQWLESATGIYHFRARDYDSKTGMFLSRDPVDPNEQSPEAMNPYQAMYNNPYLYSDPTGMFTIMEMNANFSVQNSLEAARTYAGNEVKQYLKSKVGEALGNAFTGFVKKLLPLNDIPIDALPKRFQDGNMFEDYLKGQICGIFNAVGGPFVNRLWMEPSVLREGIPSAPGLSCGELFDEQTRKGFKRGKGSSPDFIFKDGSPMDTSNKAFLIGDVKLTMAGALRDVTGTGSKSGNPHNQWTAMRAYAKKHVGVPMVLYVTFKRYSKGNQMSDQQLASEFAKAYKASFAQGVILTIANLLD